MEGMTIKDNSAPEVFLKKFPEAIPEIPNFIVVQISFGNLAGFPKSHDEKNIFSPGPPSGLVACTMNERFNRRSLPDIQELLSPLGRRVCDRRRTIDLPPAYRLSYQSFPRIELHLCER